MEKVWWTCAPNQKLFPGYPFLILVNNPKQEAHARNPFENKIFWKRIIKNLKKGNWFILLHPISFDERKGSGTSHQSFFKLQNMFRKFPGQFSWFNTKWFLNYSKNYICLFIKTISQRHNYSTFISLLGSGKCGKKGKKYKNVIILRMKRAF